MPTDPIHPSHAPRVSLVVAFGAFVLLAVLVVFLHRTPAPVVQDPAAVAESDRWKLTEKGRLQALADLRAREAKEATTLAWIDQSKGLVRLPIDVAMEITQKEIAASRR